MKAIIITVIASMTFVGFSVKEVFSGIEEYRVATPAKAKSDVVIYGHRIGPGGQLIILTER